MNTKNRFIFTVMLCCAILTGCTGGQEVNSVVEVSDEAVMSDSGFYSGTNSFESVPEPSMAEYEEDEDFTYEARKSKGNVEIAEEEIEPVDRDMLVYRGNVTITTKEFDKDLSRVKDTLKGFDCFFENESKWTDYSYDDRNLYHYSATVRVPSKNYNALLDGLNGVGTVTNLSSSCENVSAEYSDTVVAIDIYEAERDRYINLLRTITDDQYAIEVQRELTDIELKLAQFRARKKNIETDVSYSYVTIDLSEVRDYVQQTEYNETFLQRLWNTIANTFFGFVTFLEGFLFLLIRVSPYILFFSLLYFILKRTGLLRLLSRLWPFCVIKKKVSDRRERRMREREELAARRAAIENANKTAEQKKVENAGWTKDSSCE